MDQPPLGHKAPRPGMGRLAFCPACPAGPLTNPTPMSSRHVFLKYFKLLFNAGMFLRTVRPLRLLEEAKESENSWVSATAMGWAWLLHFGTMSLDLTQKGTRLTSRITSPAAQAFWSWLMRGWKFGSQATKCFCTLWIVNWMCCLRLIYYNNCTIIADMIRLACGTVLPMMLTSVNFLPYRWRWNRIL